jgi:hypothetical protein
MGVDAGTLDRFVWDPVAGAPRDNGHDHESACYAKSRVEGLASMKITPERPCLGKRMDLTGILEIMHATGMELKRAASSGRGAGRALRAELSSRHAAAPCGSDTMAAAR